MSFEHINQTKKRKKRLAVACLECRLRKEKCDRNVPGCSNCKRRDINCKWGDDRDENEQETFQLSYHQTLSLTNQNQHQDTPDEIETYASGLPYVPSHHPDDVDKKLQPMVSRILPHLPRREQVRHLTNQFLTLPQHIYYCIDVEEFSYSLESIYTCLGQVESAAANSFGLPSPASSSSSSSPPLAVSIDLLTRMLFVLAASARQVPPSYLVALGIASSDRAASEKIKIWLHDALECFDACHQFKQLCFPILQASAIFFIWLSDCTPVHQCTAIIDASIRAATQLGLDRLASAIWDEEYLKRGLMKQKNSNNMIWSAQLLAKGDTSTRELGRAVWYAFVYLGSPHADYGDLSTKLPRVGAVDSDGYNPFRCWQHFSQLTVILQDWKQLQARAEAIGSIPDYLSVQAISDRLRTLEREQAPVSDMTHFILQRQAKETHSDFRLREKKTAQSACFAMLLQLKILLIHRPLMGAGYRDPQMHGFSVQIAVQSAHSLLEGARRFQEKRWAHFGSIFGKNALLLASLVLLLDMFHKPRSLDLEEGLESYQHISIAIEHLKFGEATLCHPNSIFYKVGSKLEALLTGCTRRASLQMQESSSLPLDDTISQTSILSDITWLDNLDWQLFQAVHGSSLQADANGDIWPRQVFMTNEEQSTFQTSFTDSLFNDCDGIWSDIFSTIGMTP